MSSGTKSNAEASGSRQILLISAVFVCLMNIYCLICTIIKNRQMVKNEEVKIDGVRISVG